MKQELESVLDLVREAALSELPRLLGEIELIKFTALSRLSAPVVSSPQTDQLLDVNQAARRLNVSTQYLYQTDLPFVRHVGRRRLYSALGIEKYIRQSR